MKEIFDAVNQVFDFVVPIADFLWGFPTNFDWYASIPILGNLSFAIVILIGSGIFFSIKTGFIQVTHFRKGLRILVDRKTAAVGITPLAAFLSAMLAMNNTAIPHNFGVIGSTAEQTAKNLGRISMEGMAPMDSTIISVMQEKR